MANGARKVELSQHELLALREATRFMIHCMEKNREAFTGFKVNFTSKNDLEGLSAVLTHELNLV